MKAGAPLAVMTFVAGDRGLLRFRRVREHTEKDHGAHVFEIPELERYLAQADFGDFRPQRYGSVLVFRACKQGRAVPSRRCALFPVPTAHRGAGFRPADENAAKERRDMRRIEPLTWKIFGLLVGGALVGSLAIIPYALSLQELPPSLPIPLWLLLLIGTVQNLLLFAGVTALGLWLGGKVGLGAPVLRAWLAGDDKAPHRFRAALPLAIGLGVIAAVIILLLERLVFAPLLPEALQAKQAPPAWQGFLAAFYGGINEELLMRLGLMSLLAWAGARATRQERPGGGVMWTANVLTALLFGVGHLPTLAMLAPLTVMLVVRTLLLNGIAGVLFGWLYWRRGLLAAMVSHFSADIVLHVIGAVLG